MRPQESYTTYVSVALLFTVLILVVFQVYLGQEDTRIDEHKAEDHAMAVAEGRHLYGENCTACHGENGEGGVAPSLNNRALLSSTSDEALFNLIRIGIPGTIMPAWGQAFGGPLTDQQVNQLVAFIRAWEPTAPDIVVAENVPDPVAGAAIYSRTCFVCHGEDGQGTDIAPALNDPQRLNQLDDAWYRNTIVSGRPAKGMPTWGTVLSPEQIDDVVALIGAWREGEAVTDDTPFAVHVSNALKAINDFDREDAEFYLEQALPQASDGQADEIRAIIGLVQENQLFAAQEQLAALLPPLEKGQVLFTNNCSSCHGETGTGGLGPNLHANDFIQSQEDAALLEFLQTGRPGTAMSGFQGVLTPDELETVIAVLRSWQE